MEILGLKYLIKGRVYLRILGIFVRKKYSIPDISYQVSKSDGFQMMLKITNMPLSIW